MSTITAEIITARQLTLVPLRAEHAAEMAAVLADPACTGSPADPRPPRRSCAHASNAGWPARLTPP